MDSDTVSIILNIIILIGVLFCAYNWENEIDMTYTSIMEGDFVYIDSYIEKTQKGEEKYIVVYEENEEIKKIRFDFNEFYRIEEKYKKTIDKT